MNLFWVTTKDHDQDWFVAAESPTDAAAFFEQATGYDPGAATAELVLEIPAEAPTETGWPLDHLLLALGAEFIYESIPRLVQINGQRYFEGKNQK